MKKLLSLFAILSFVSGIAYAYDGDGNTNKKREIEGAPGYFAYREYQLVRFAANGVNDAGLSAGDVVVGDCVSDDGISVAVVGATSSGDAVRGVVVSATIPTSDVTGTTAITDFGRRNWGYVQVKGLCTKVNELATNLAPAGSTLVQSSVGRNATGAAATPQSSGMKPLGFALDTGTSGSTNDVYIDL